MVSEADMKAKSEEMNEVMMKVMNKLSNQSLPLQEAMTKKSLQCFQLSTDAQSVMQCVEEANSLGTKAISIIEDKLRNVESELHSCTSKCHMLDGSGSTTEMSNNLKKCLTQCCDVSINDMNHISSSADVEFKKVLKNY